MSCLAFILFYESQMLTYTIAMSNLCEALMTHE